MSEDFFIPMYSIESEMCCLGSALLSDAAIKLITQNLTEKDFFRPAHKLIFKAISAIADRRAPLDMITLEAEIGSDIANIGGSDYLLEISMFTPSAANVDGYIETVLERSRLRDLCELGKKIYRLASAGTASSEIANLLDSSFKKSVDPIEFEFPSSIDRSGEDIGIPTGFKGIDSQLAVKGWPLGQMSVVVAQEKAGKSLVMLQSASEACKSGLKVCYATFGDLNKKRVLWRLQRLLCGYSTNEVAAKYGDAALEDSERAEAEINDEWRLRIYDATRSAAHRSIDRFLANLEIHQDGPTPFDLIFLDYAQKLASDKANASNQVALGDYCSDAISACAERTGIPIVVGSQLTGANAREGRDAMTKGSRKWLEDCGIALMVLAGEGDARQIEIYRSRFGGMGTVRPYGFNKTFVRFDPVSVPGN